MEKVRERIELWKKNEWITDAPKDCKWNSPILVAAKPAKEKGEKDDIRLCLDARFLNDRIVEMPDSNLPLLRDVLDRLGNFQWITLIDLADSYHQFELNEEDRPKTAFTIEGHQYMFKVVPFGLKIMTGHMQRIMERLLGDLKVMPFQDDIAIGSPNTKNHIEEVKNVLKRITYDAGLRIRFNKCKFFKTEARVLGIIVSREGLQMDPKKIDAIINWPRPVDGKSMQRFMGAANFHREFTHEFAKIAAPLEECRTMKKIDWTQERINAFEQLKKIFQKNILLEHINWNKKMYLTTDASLCGIGAWIGQINDFGELSPIICASKKLNPTQQRWSATKRELYALMWAMKRFRHYLLGHHFIARVDHKPLVAMMKNRSTILTEGWIETIMEYNFTTEYIPGDTNQMADSLSRCHDTELELHTLKIENTKDLDAKLVFEAELRGYQFPSIFEQEEIIQRHHALGHFGLKLMLDKIHEEGFYWPKMRKDIETVIKNCQQCQRYNIEKEGFHPARSITAYSPWDHLQIDLIGPVPTSESGASYILTLVDVCTGYVVLRSLPNKEMETVARSLWKIFCEYGTPKILQSDNGSEFVNQAVQAMTHLYGVDHRLITAYHPNANGLVERKNKDVSQALKKYTEGSFAAWDDWLPLIQLGLNEGINQRTGSTAFALMYGRSFNNFHDFTNIEINDSSINTTTAIQESWTNFKNLVLPALENRTSNVKIKQEQQLNKRKQMKPLQPGTYVMAIDNLKSSKWEPNYEGPFEILCQNEGGTYTLLDTLGREIPRHYTINMLKPLSNKPNDLSSEGGKQEEINTEEHKSYVVEDIIAHELVGSKGYKYLVKWKDYPTSDNSWIWAKNFDSLTPINKYWKKQKQQMDSKKTIIQKKRSKRKQLESSQSSDFQSRREPCDDIQHISTIYLGSTSKRKSSGRGQIESTVNDSQNIARKRHYSSPRASQGKVPTTS